MTTTTSLQTIFHCSLESAFKTPILCDVTKIHTGFGLMPKVTHCTEDDNWGQPGSTKRVFTAPSLTFAGGEASVDKVLERRENEYWKIEVSEFKSWMLGFTHFIGEWKTRELEPGVIAVEYVYTLHANGFWWYPFNWLFTHIFWRRYMQKVTENIRQLAYSNEPYLYA